MSGLMARVSVGEAGRDLEGVFVAMIEMTE